MDWLVFGDDWGAHPSTTQHLVRALLAQGDRALWVDSIGMRPPRPKLADLRRVARRFQPSKGVAGPELPAELTRHRPLILPWHGSALCRRANRRLFTAPLARNLEQLGFSSPTALLANPLAYAYLPSSVSAVVYLRLDDYARLPGVEARWVTQAEPALLAQANLVAYTARRLQPSTGRGLFLPQGVDVALFSAVSLAPPAARTLGFFGLLAEWMDFELILQVARAHPDWTLEFVGPARQVPATLLTQRNVKCLPPVPYPALPQAIAHWRAAWIPFRVDELTQSVNPLKLREYLAAGLPVASTPMPEVEGMPGVVTVRSVDEVSAFLKAALKDSSAAREARRASVAHDSWAARARRLKEALCP